MDDVNIDFNESFERLDQTKRSLRRSIWIGMGLLIVSLPAMLGSVFLLVLTLSFGSNDGVVFLYGMILVLAALLAIGGRLVLGSILGYIDVTEQRSDYKMLRSELPQSIH